MSSQALERLKNSTGVYTVLMDLTEKGCIKIGRLGEATFRKGFYIYIGSALGRNSTSLGWRLLRYKTISNRRTRWHIDYLLRENSVRIVSIIFAEATQRRECAISKALSSEKWTDVPLKKFGASDCHENCPAHLYRCNISNIDYLKEEVRRIFEENDLTPIVLEAD